ncbi:hypothetical protein Taro_004029, partial [Colocasia esculenta]|nr:hypothetical protein [Colocasia esculenta]
KRRRSNYLLLLSLRYFCSDRSKLHDEQQRKARRGEAAAGAGGRMDGEKTPRLAWKTPLVFHSKLLCLSLLYLLTSLFVSIHVSVSQTGCVFRLAPLPLSDHEQRLGHPLFSYPPAYGEHKHALPSSSPEPTCESSVLFSDYLVALEEIRRLSRNWSYPRPAVDSSVLRYETGKKGSFAGNFSTQERISYLRRGGGVDGDGGDDWDSSVEVPCGFFRQFPIPESDRRGMENCRGVVVASAIFGNHDKLRQPKGVGLRTLETVCFFVFVDDATLRDLARHRILPAEGTGIARVGVWRVIGLPTAGLPYKNPAMNGIVPKYLLHRLFPNSKFSIWVDAKMQLTVDPLLLVHSLLIADGGADMAVSMHPLNVHTMEEVVATARWRKWPDVEGLRRQMETYCENGLQPWSPAKLPYTTDVPDTAIILRRHNLRSNLFSCLLFNELEAFNPRDQVPFAFVRDLMRPRIKINMFPAEVLEQIAVEYRHNLKRPQEDPSEAKSREKMRRASSRGVAGSSCEAYLLKLWGDEANDSE